MNGSPENQKSTSAPSAIAPTGTKKECTRCRKSKAVKDFTDRKAGKNGKNSICRDCTNEIMKLWRHANPERNKETEKRSRAKNSENNKLSTKIWRLKNKKRIKDNEKIYTETHKDQMREKWNKASVKKRSTPKGLLSWGIKGNIYNSIREAKAGRRWESLVGYTVDDLKRHLEKLFLPGMGWDNYGRNGWHIDHKIPVSVFNFNTPDDADFKKCWSLKNLQPMWEKENIIKSNNLERPFQPSLAIGV